MMVIMLLIVFTKSQPTAPEIENYFPPATNRKFE